MILSDTFSESEDDPYDQRRLFILEKDGQRWSAVVTEDEDEVHLEFPTNDVEHASDPTFLAWHDWLTEEFFDGRVVHEIVSIGDAETEQTYDPNEYEDETDR